MVILSRNYWSINFSTYTKKLIDSRKDLASYKCPTAKEIESTSTKAGKGTGSEETLNQTIPKDIPSDNTAPEIIEPVKSI